MAPESTTGRAFILAPGSWSRWLDWLPALSAYVVAVPADCDVTLCLDGRSADIDPGTLRAVVQRACEYLVRGA